jgi:hypothetical protein
MKNYSVYIILYYSESKRQLLLYWVFQQCSTLTKQKSHPVREWPFLINRPHRGKLIVNTRANKLIIFV